MIFSVEGKTPKFGASWFAPPLEEDGVVAGEYCDGVFLYSTLKYWPQSLMMRMRL